MTIFREYRFLSEKVEFLKVSNHLCIVCISLCQNATKIFNAGQFKTLLRLNDLIMQTFCSYVNVFSISKHKYFKTHVEVDWNVEFFTVERVDHKTISFFMLNPHI